MENAHRILELHFLGIKANNKTVSVVKTVMECPEGKLENPTAFFPMMIKLSLSNTIEGLGTEKMFFSTLENIAETIDADSNASHILGAYSMKIVKSDKIMEASPNCVILYSRFGNCPK